MTEKQKQAISLLNRLKEDMSDEEYFLLLDFVLVSTPKTPVIMPYTQTIPCFAPNGVCSNPFRDCIGCPKSFGSGYTTSTTADTNVTLNKE